MTVYRPPPSKKNGFTVERFFSEFSALSEELTVTFCQFLLCGDFNFHVDVDSNANAKQFSDLFFRLICHPLWELIGTTSWNWSQRCEKGVCAVKCALTSAAAVLVHFDPEFPVELSVDAISYGLGAVIMHVYPNGNRRSIAYEDAIYRVEELLVHSSEFVKQGWPQHVEDLRLQPFFNCRLELSVEQDCLPWGPRVIKPTRF